MLKKEIFNLYQKLGSPPNEAAAEFNMILDYLNIPRFKEITYGFSAKEEKDILKIVRERIKTQKPLQQIVGFGYFMGEKFFVDENTLIPRPETEILVNECTKLINKNHSFLDIGTGTGCIAIELNKFTGAKADAIDISEKALEIAKKNNILHKTNCNFIKSDLFSNINKKYDLIVSNPPYIPQNAINTVDKQVFEFEPHDALFTKDEYGTEFYEKIIEQALTFLNKNGYLAFEIGINQFERIEKMLKNQSFSDIKIIKDLDNIERVIISKKIT